MRKTSRRAEPILKLNILLFHSIRIRLARSAQNNPEEIYVDERYTKLAGFEGVMNDSKNIHKKVDVFAVILGAAPPRMLGNGQWMVTLTLCDESCSEADKTVVLNVFNKEVSKLPICACAGDVIR